MRWCQRSAPHSDTFRECHSAALGVAEDVVGLLLHGSGLAFLDVVFVPGGDFRDVGAGLFDDTLTAEAAVELQAGGEVEAVQLEVLGFGDAFGALLQKDVAGGAGGDAAAGVVQEDAVVFGDVEEGHREAVAVVGQGVEGELDGFVFGLKGDAHHIFGGRLGEIDFRERDFVVRHVSLYSSRERFSVFECDYQSLSGMPDKGFESSPKPPYGVLDLKKAFVLYSFDIGKGGRLACADG